MENPSPDKPDPDELGAAGAGHPNPPEVWEVFDDLPEPPDIARSSGLADSSLSSYGSFPFRFDEERLAGLIQELGGVVENAGLLADNAYFRNLKSGGVELGRNARRPRPVERPDPYPTRAGWRAHFAPPHNPYAPEKADVPAGSIGGFDIIRSATTLADVGGNNHAKRVLREIICQYENAQVYEKWDVPVPKGVLLYGDSGLGKTMLARAFAGTANAAFVEIPVAVLRDKYYGETEKNLKQIFDQAAKYGKPIVLFFDEIDSLLPDRRDLPASHPDAEMVRTFLQAVDGIESAKNVMVLGATNYPDRLDPAAIRPGRFDHKVQLEYPDKAACQEILAKQLLAAERRAGRPLAADQLDLDEIGLYVQNLTGAHIAEMLNRLKRTMAQTERTMGRAATLDGLEALTFGKEALGALVITTDDILAMAIQYRLELAGIPPADRPGDDPPQASPKPY